MILNLIEMLEILQKSFLDTSHKYSWLPKHNTVLQIACTCIYIDVLSSVETTNNFLITFVAGAWKTFVVKQGRVTFMHKMNFILPLNYLSVCTRGGKVNFPNVFTIFYP